jgi:hypothetical protein
MYPSGLWYNELGSWMTLQASGNNVWGTYYSKVGRAAYTYPLVGMIDPSASSPSGQALAWTVAWSNSSYGNSHSATGWCGQYQGIGADEEIIALWLLASETDPANNWRSTNVGQDIFGRTPKSAEEVKRNQARLAVSHPMRPAEDDVD